MTLYSYPITIEREGKQYYAYSEDFPGVYGLGRTIEAAKKSILEAMRTYIAGFGLQKLKALSPRCGMSLSRYGVPHGFRSPIRSHHCR